jgi:predicted amidohydrolase YtcJ
MGHNGYPSRQDLDEVVPDVPVLLLRACLHIGVTNSAGLRAAVPTTTTTTTHTHTHAHSLAFLWHSIHWWLLAGYHEGHAQPARRADR